MPRIAKRLLDRLRSKVAELKRLDPDGTLAGDAIERAEEALADTSAVDPATILLLISLITQIISLIRKLRKK